MEPVLLKEFWGTGKLDKVEYRIDNRPLILLLAALWLSPAAFADEVESSKQTRMTSGALSERELIVADNVTLTGLLNTGSQQHLASQNTTVIDLRTLNEQAIDEAIQMSAAGITYYHLPIGADGLQPATVASLKKILATTKDQPVVLHCKSGTRAGMLWAAHLIDDGMSNADALAEVNDIIAADTVRDAISAYETPVVEAP